MKRFSMVFQKPCLLYTSHLMAAHSHPDFHVLASQEGKDIGVDQVRAIYEIVSQHAHQNGNKLVYRCV